MHSILQTGVSLSKPRLQIPHQRKQFLENFLNLFSKTTAKKEDFPNILSSQDSTAHRKKWCAVNLIWVDVEFDLYTISNFNRDID